MLKISRSEKGGAIVAVLMVAVLLNIALALVYFTINSSVKKSGERRAKTTSLNAAEAAKEKLYGMIRSGQFKPVAKTRLNAFTNQTFGKAVYSVSCSTDVSGDTLYILATGKENNTTKKLEIVGVLAPPIDFPVPSVKGAVTARNHIEILGNIDVDGRDYDSVWNNVILGPGLFGVSTCSTLTLNGSSSVGGNGMAPVGKNQFTSYLNTIYEQYVPVTDQFNSPESFLGVAPGKLDPYKVSTLPPAPFHGVYYLNANEVGPLHFGDFSSGVLIVSNATKTAELKANTGTFKGIIIVDKVTKLNGNAQILGAVVTLNDGQVVELSDPMFGNGTARIRYSSRILNNLGSYCSNLLRDVKEISWREIQ